MSSTRNFNSPGIFAENASTTIPPTPIAGASYRDAANGTDEVPNGWQYGTRVDSKDWNQIMYLATSMLDMMDKKGLLGWTSLTVYSEPAVAFGSDGKIYKWLQESGPGTAAGARDPVSEPLYWSEFGNQSQLIDSLRINVASASNINLTTAAPSTRHINITGTTTINGFTVEAGLCYFVRFGGVMTITNGASIVTQTGASIVTAVGDTCIIRATANNTVEILCGNFLSQRALGSGQTWQNLTTSRSSGVTYTNDTGRSIAFSVSVDTVTGAETATVSVGGTILYTGDGGIAGMTASLGEFIVPPGATYSVSVSSSTITRWVELR